MKDYHVFKKEEWDFELKLAILNMQLRPLDVHECALAGQSMAEAIKHAVDASEYLSAIVDATTLEPLAIYGVASDEDDESVGIPWLLAIPDFKMTKTWLKECKAEVFPEMQALYPTLRNYVYKGNRESILWLRWLGFSMHETEHDELLMFERRRDV